MPKKSLIASKQKLKLESNNSSEKLIRLPKKKSREPKTSK